MKPEVYRAYLWLVLNKYSAAELAILYNNPNYAEDPTNPEFRLDSFLGPYIV